jgi:hypothetical protein
VLADIDHPYAAKRPPIDTGYFETFNRDNVSLVDVSSAPIERITPAGLRTAAAEYPLDFALKLNKFVREMHPVPPWKRCAARDSRQDPQWLSARAGGTTNRGHQSTDH